MVTPSREKAVWGGLWCRKFAHRLGIPVPQLRWYSGPEWVPFGFCPDPRDEPATIYVRSNMPLPFTISTIAHELVHYGGGDEKAAQRYERRVAALIEPSFGLVVRPVQPGRARLNASWRRSVAGELVVV